MKRRLSFIAALIGVLAMFVVVSAGPSTAINLHPLGDNVVIRESPEAPAQGQGALESRVGDVIAVGPGAFSISGIRIPLDLAQGDKVVFVPDTAIEVTIEGEQLWLVPQDEVLAVIG